MFAALGRSAFGGPARCSGRNDQTNTIVEKGTDQADLKQRIKEIAETRVRYGYRRIHVLLRRESWVSRHRIASAHPRPSPASIKAGAL